MAPNKTNDRTILVIAPTPFFADRGCHVRIYEEVKLIQELGYQVIVATYHIGRDIEGVTTYRTPRIPWYQKLGPGPSFHKLYIDGLLFLSCIKLVLRHRPALLHGHLHEGAMIAGLLGKIFAIPSVADYQGSLVAEIASYEFGHKHRLTLKVLGWIERLIDQLPDQTFTSTEAFGRDLVDHFALPPDRVIVLKDGVGQGYFRERDLTLRARYELGPDDQVVIYMGVLTRAQGVDILLSAIPRVLDANDRARFVIIGFPNECRYEAELARQGYSRRVQFLGRIKYHETPDLLAMADLAVSPKTSMTEGNGKLYNYMACGLPTVVFDTPTNREILGDGGIYVQAKKSADFANAVLQALSQIAESRQRGEAGRCRALERYSWIRQLDLIQGVYDALIPDRAKK